MSSTFNFEEIGLSVRDKRVYEALLAWPGSSLRAIATETGINRGSVYESMKTLLSSGLVSTQVGKQQRYTANDPALLLELLRERQLQAVHAQTTAKEYIATFAHNAPSQPVVPIGTYYEDYEGIASILRDVLATCRTRNGKAYRVISTSSVREFMYENFRNFTSRRIAAGISVRVISVGVKGKSEDALSERHDAPQHRNKTPNCYTLIYGNKTAFITRNEQGILSAILIDNRGITDLQKELFDQQWKALT